MAIAGKTLSGKVAESVWPLASVTVTRRLKSPLSVGVPPSAPTSCITRPAGTPVAVNVYGGVPPVALTACEYGYATVQSGNVDSTSARGGAGGPHEQPDNETSAAARRKAMRRWARTGM